MIGIGLDKSKYSHFLRMRTEPFNNMALTMSFHTARSQHHHRHCMERTNSDISPPGQAQTTYRTLLVVTKYCSRISSHMLLFAKQEILPIDYKKTYGWYCCACAGVNYGHTDRCDTCSHEFCGMCMRMYK